MDRDQSQIRIKSEVGTVKHVEALQFFFLLAQISSIVVLNVKNLAFTPHSVCVCALVVVVVGGGRGQDVMTIRTSIMTPLSATVSRVSTARGVGAVLVGGGGQWLQMHFTLTARVGICERYITMEMSKDVR